MDERNIISEWFYLYSNDVYNFLVYYQGSKDVHDLVQEVFIKAMKGVSSFRNEANPKTWLISIARHVAIDHARKKKRRIDDATAPLEEQITIGNSDVPDDVLVENESMQDLYMAIKALKSNYRDVVMLRGIEDMSTKETAAVLGWTESKVKQTYHRAKKSLQKQLLEKGDIAHGS
ncbi:MAG TPA: RNA polymerase sigma factor [Bacillota bacterium]|nr:RNA polymerase sigma factor [Bacillota bacterium]